MAAHAKLSPSASHRWMRCPGSVNACESVEDVGSEAATRGTATHALGADLLCNHEYEVGDYIHFREDDVQKDMEIDDEMMESIMVYVDHVKTTLEYMKDPEMYLEQKVSIHGQFGTADCIILDKTTLNAMDYKNGRTPVHIQDEYDESYNSQLMFYAAAALKKYDEDNEIQMVTITVVQPNCPAVKQVQWRTLPAHEVRQWAATELKQAIKAASKPDAPLVAGEWCTWCPAAATCPALKEQVQDIACVDFAEVARERSLPDVNKLSKEQIINVLRWLPVLDSWGSAVVVHAQQEMERGESYNGFKLIRKTTHRKWPEGIKSPALLAQALGLHEEDVIAEPALLSPAQVEKINKVVKAKVADVAIKPEGGLVIAPLSDPHEAVQPSADFQDFAGGEDLV